MDPKTAQILLGAAGAAGGGAALYVDDVFGINTWQGTGSAQTIDNGIDLTEGGLVWTKVRGVGDNHHLGDSARGKTGTYFDELQSDTTNPESTTRGWGYTSFNSNGFSLAGNNFKFNNSSWNYCSWTFRKAPGFFDCLTYTGNGSSGLQISHALGSTPGAIFIKKTSATEGWYVFHRSAGTSKRLFLNQNNAQESESNGITAVSSSTFTLGTLGAVNDNNASYVAYVFAHDDQSFGTNSDEAIIKCGVYTGNGSDPNGPTVSLGFEPQWLLIKRQNATESWYIHDSIRFMNERNEVSLRADMNLAEERNTSKGIRPTPDGFQIRGLVSTNLNNNGSQYVYIAIRRPNKPPEAGTDVFAADTQSNNSPAFTSNFPVDIVMRRANFSSSDNTDTHHRIIDGYAALNSNAAISDASGRDKFDQVDGWGRETSNNTNKLAFMFKRVSTFMNQVVYAGNGSNRTVEHGLNAIPEFYVVKKMTSTGNFESYHSGTGNGKRIILNDTNGALSTSIWQSTSPTSTVVSVSSDSSVNASGQDYLLTTFATVPGVSKVGSYSGTGNAIDVDCGFTAGARVVFIKRTDTEIQGAGGTHIYCFNTLKGIVSGNDPFFHINESMTPVTNQDNIDPLNAGFTITAAAPAGLNASGGTYVFLAIA